MVFAPLIARSSGAAIARRTIIAPAVRFASTSSPLKASPSPSSLLSASAFKSLSRSNVSKALQSAKVEVAGNQVSFKRWRRELDLPPSDSPNGLTLSLVPSLLVRLSPPDLLRLRRSSTLPPTRFRTLRSTRRLSPSSSRESLPTRSLDPS
ncbi:hypothetical protein BDY24DRAFT_399470 [Mrakia frigida]|uniref:uncharacterized protein n=1 Tax=Mrakia frigida TaxID=29902 RepID=UPI003FCBF93D